MSRALLRCERVCKGWRDVLRQPKCPGLWGTQLGLSGRQGARSPWHTTVQGFDREARPWPYPWWHEATFRKEAVYDSVLSWLYPRIAGFSILSLELDNDSWYLLPEVLAMRRQLLTPHFEIKLKSGNFEGCSSHDDSAAVRLIALEQRSEGLQV